VSNPNAAAGHVADGARTPHSFRLRRWLPALAVATLAVVRWLDLTAPLQAGMGPFPDVGPRAASTEDTASAPPPSREGHAWGFGHPRWIAKVGPSGAPVYAGTVRGRSERTGGPRHGPVDRASPGAVLPVHTLRSGRSARPSWACVESLHLLDASGDGQARDATDWLLATGPEALSLGGAFVPCSNLRPVTVRDLPTSDGVHAELLEFVRVRATRVRCWQAGPRDRPVVLMRFEVLDPELPTADLQMTAYQVRADGSMEWLISRHVVDSPLSRACLRVVEETVQGESVPDVLSFIPPVGLVCWRWDAQRYRRALPTPAEVGTLLCTGFAGAAFAIGCLAWAGILAAAGWRLTAAPDAPARAGWVTAALLAAWLWHPLLALVLLVPAAAALWGVGVRPTASRGCLSLIALLASPVAVCVLVILCWAPGPQ